MCNCLRGVAHLKLAEVRSKSDLVKSGSELNINEIFISPNSNTFSDWRITRTCCELKLTNSLGRINLTNSIGKLVEPKMGRPRTFVNSLFDRARQAESICAIYNKICSQMKLRMLELKKETYHCDFSKGQVGFGSGSILRAQPVYHRNDLCYGVKQIIFFRSFFYF